MPHFLKRLELNGFKSFAGKTVLEFPSGITAIVGPNGSGKCLDGDSLIFLADGRRIKIRALVENALLSNSEKMDDGFCTLQNPEGIEIFSLNTETQKVEKANVMAFIKRKSPKYLLRIKTRSGREIRATPYHPLFTTKDGCIRALRADELRGGIKIIVPRLYPVSANDNALDLNEVFRAFVPEDRVYVPYSKPFRSYIEGLSNFYGGMVKLCKSAAINFRSISSISSGQGINVAYVESLRVIAQTVGYQDAFRFTEFKSKGTGKMRIPTELNSDLARFLGYIISEGRINESAQVWFVNSDPALIQDFVKVTQNVFGLQAKIFAYKKTSSDVIVFSRVLTKFLDRIFGLAIGGSSFEKKIPPQLFQATSDVVWEFISALFEGDGFFNVKTRGTRHQIYVEYATASKELAEDLVALLLRESVQSRIISKTKYASNTLSKTKRRYHSVFISGAPNLKILADRLNLIGEKKSKLELIRSLKIQSNPNLDVIPEITSLIKRLVKEAKVKIKPIRHLYPKLAAYCENRCDVSRGGLKEVLGAIQKYGITTRNTKELFRRLRIFSDSHVYYDEIIEIDNIKSDEWVYDLCVEPHRNFIANNIVVHNSNVVDAVRWLLGERDAKNLRGAKIDDLIFAGTAKRPRLGMATASLHLENKNNFFPVDFAEVSVVRQISRDGQSKYFLNKSEVLLRDLVDFLAKARLGSRGMIVVTQGNSDVFINSTPRERREMIEEILGLREYQLKKADAERRLKNSQINLDKVGALVEEILPHLRSLKRQTSRWERRGALEEELKNLENQFFGSQMRDIRESAEAVQVKIDGAKGERVAYEKEKKAAEDEQRRVEASQPEGRKDIEKIKAQTQSLLERRSQLQKELGRIEAQIEMGIASTPRDASGQAGQAGQASSAAKILDHIKEIKDILTSGLHGDTIEMQEAIRSAIEEINVILEEDEEVVRLRSPQADAPKVKMHEANPALTVQFEKVDKDLRALEKEMLSLKEKEGQLEKHQEAFYHAFKAAVASVEAAKEKIEKWETRNREHVFEKERLEFRREELERQIAQAGRRAQEFTESAMTTSMADDSQTIERRIFKLRGDLASIGEIDEALMKEARETESRYEFLSKESDDLNAAVRDLRALIADLTEKIKNEFDKSLIKINEEFGKFFELMFGGGHAKLRVEKLEAKVATDHDDDHDNNGEDEKDEDEDEEKYAPEQVPGLEIELRLPRKKINSLEMLSGGERSLVGIAALFSMISVSPPPFLVLDEIDAALDERNARRFSEMLKEFSKKTQFIVVTHNRATMEAADILYGVTLSEDGTSKILSLKLEAQ